MTLKPSRLVAALSYLIDPAEVNIPTDVMLQVGREIWRVSNGSRYETWSDLCGARNINGPVAHAKWSTFLTDHDGPDVIEDLARSQGWDGGFDRSERPMAGLWDEWALDAPDFLGSYVIRPPRATTGVVTLDAALGGGLASGTYTALGGEGGCGKTALGVCCAYANMRMGAFKPLLYSLEIPRTEVIARMLSRHGEWLRVSPPIRWADLCAADPDDQTALDTWRLTQDERDEHVRDYLAKNRGTDPVIVAWENMTGRMVGNIAIRDGVTCVDDICAEIDQVVAEGVHVLPIIDHMHVLEPPRGMRADSEYERVTAVSNALMACTKRNNVPMLALAEIRNVGEKERDTPRLNWFRGSGHVGYDAGCAVMLTRTNSSDEVDATVVKNRHGQAGAKVRLGFNGATNALW